MSKIVKFNGKWVKVTGGTVVLPDTPLLSMSGARGATLLSTGKKGGMLLGATKLDEPGEDDTNEANLGTGGDYYVEDR